MSIENASAEKSSAACRSRPVLLPSVFPARSLILLVACLLTASAGNAQSKNASEYAKRLDSFIEETLREKEIPGVAVGIVEDGRLVYARGFGVMKVGDTSKPVTAETLFHMASVTKPFVATVVSARRSCRQGVWEELRGLCGGEHPAAARHDFEHSASEAGGPGQTRDRLHSGQGRDRETNGPLPVQSRTHAQFEPALEYRGHPLRTHWTGHSADLGLETSGLVFASRD
jgi:hypothetical protein